MDPNIIDSGVAWYAGEVTRHALLHLPWILGWLLGTGVITVLGVLIFGRGYKKTIAEQGQKIAEQGRQIEELQRRVNEKPAPVAQPTETAGQITPKDTITDRGVLSLYESGYVKGLTPWKDLEDGKEANHPAGPPRATWKDSPGAGRLVAQAIRKAESLEAAHAIFDAHYASPNRQDTPAAALALARRMEAAGEDSTLFFHKMAVEGVDLDDEIGRGDS